ncbi:MAG: UxaA family hydrolase [Rhodospirillales bacterium]|jgi:hypothetical protein|nr:UxaA family hydrolase [Rhodospirillales bacterium]
MIEEEHANLAEGKNALVLDPKDNVAVALTDLAAGEGCLVIQDGGERFEVVVNENIAFGHKFALADLEKDDAVFKYGEEIGRMKEPLARGGWIHVHNMYCDKGMK